MVKSSIRWLLLQVPFHFRSTKWWPELADRSKRTCKHRQTPAPRTGSSCRWHVWHRASGCLTLMYVLWPVGAVSRRATRCNFPAKQKLQETLSCTNTDVVNAVPIEKGGGSVLWGLMWKRIGRPTPLLVVLSYPGSALWPNSEPFSWVFVFVLSLHTLTHSYILMQVSAEPRSHTYSKVFMWTKMTFENLFKGAGCKWFIIL